MPKLTPKQRAQKAAISSQSKLFERLSRQELEARRQPIKAVAETYNLDMGEWEATTPDGGSVLVKSTTNANVKGKRLPVQRFQGSQEGAISEAPTDADFSGVYEQLETVSQTLVTLMPWQFGTGDPNNETVSGLLDVVPRYAGDSFFRTDTGLAFRWDNDLENDPPAPAWVPVFQAGLSAGGADPNDSVNGFAGYHDGDLYYEGTAGVLFRWDADLETDPPAPSWEPLRQLKQGFTGDPNDQSGSAIPVYLDGAIAVNDSGAVYTGTTSGGWSALSSGGGTQTSYLLLGSFSNPSSGLTPLTYSAALFDEIGVYNSGENTKIFLPNAGVYEIQLRVLVDFPSITDERFLGQWGFNCTFYSDSDVQTGGEPRSTHEAFGVNARDTPAPVTLQNASQSVYPTFWVSTTGTETAYAILTAYYRVLQGGSLAGAVQPTTASMQGRLIVKKLS